MSGGERNSEVENGPIAVISLNGSRLATLTAFCVTSIWDRWPNSSSPLSDPTVQDHGAHSLIRLPRADCATQMIIDLQPLIEQPWIHALIEPSFGTAHQYGESLHLHTESDGWHRRTCGSYIARAR